MALLPPAYCEMNILQIVSIPVSVYKPGIMETWPENTVPYCQSDETHLMGYNALTWLVFWHVLEALDKQPYSKLSMSRNMCLESHPETQAGVHRHLRHYC